LARLSETIGAFRKGARFQKRGFIHPIDTLDQIKIIEPLYTNGQGITQDYISAYMWYDIAASNSVESAAGALEDLAKEMTSDDIEEAKRRAQICLESNYKQCD